MCGALFLFSGLMICLLQRSTHSPAKPPRQIGQHEAQRDWLGDVKRYLQWQRDTFKGFNDALAGSARTAGGSASGVTPSRHGHDGGT
jgi:hypothetical protein